MNPLDELKSLTSLFPEPEPFFLRAEHIPGSATPEPYKSLLVHEQHMTVTMENYHRKTMDVVVVEHKQEGDLYCRKILLRSHGTDVVVQFGLVRMNLSFVTPHARAEIIAGEIPLGKVLISHNILRQVDLGAILEIECGPAVARYFNCPTGTVTYGRMATIFCNRQPAIDLLEVSRPLE